MGGGVPLRWPVPGIDCFNCALIVGCGAGKKKKKILNPNNPCYKKKKKKKKRMFTLYLHLQLQK